MDYVEWCESVLQAMYQAGVESTDFRNYGIDEQRLARRIWGDRYEEIAGRQKTVEERDILFNALFDLAKAQLVDSATETFMKLTWEGRQAAQDIFPVWEDICLIELDPVFERALKIINERSPAPGGHYAVVRDVSVNTVCCELDGDMTEEDVWEVLRRLLGYRLVFWDGGDYPDEVRSTYRGLVWETRRDFVVGARFLDGLVAEWETTSVEFKRELHLGTADQRAEFVKDVIGLANTQASGRGWLVVGFDDRTRSYHLPPDPSITQNRIEQILAQYAAPNIDVRYETIAYKGGRVGTLEVLRDPRRLPYKVSKSLGEKKRILEGQVYVRHGSQTEQPTDAERLAIEEEGERARSQAAAGD